MRNIHTMLLMTAASLALLAAPAAAADWGLGAAGGFVGLTGAGSSTSGAGNLSGSFKFGHATANAGSQSFGHAESAIGVGIGTLPAGVDKHGNPVPGGSAGDAYGNFVGANVGSGSMSTASTSATGNGFSGAGSIGAGFGQTSLAAGGVVGAGFVTLP